MKTLVVVALLALLGLLCGAVVSSINIAFEPKGCGEDCTNVAWDSLLTWGLLCLLGFPLIGTWLWKRLGGTWRALCLVAVVLAGSALLASGGVYFYKVHVQQLRPTR